MNTQDYPPLIRADAAQRLTEIQLKGPPICTAMAHIHERICRAAIEGRSEICHPFFGMKSSWPSGAAQKAVWRILEDAGYTVEHHPYPDPDNSSSGSYTVISWGRNSIAS